MQGAQRHRHLPGRRSRLPLPASPRATPEAPTFERRTVRRSVTDERRALLVDGDGAAPAPADLEREPDPSLDDPDEGQERERERGPAHERGVVREDGPERPRDRDARRQVALGGRERVRRRGGFEEEAVQEKCDR